LASQAKNQAAGAETNDHNATGQNALFPKPEIRVGRGYHLFDSIAICTLNEK
jgi:hypothetical protein